METLTLSQPMQLTALPTQDELPCDDGVPMETQRHKWQMDMLIDTISPWLDRREDGYASGNMFVYFSTAQLKNQDFKGPDFFAVLGVPKGERKSWVTWEEGKAPDVVIELLSESTAQIDKTEKKQIYQDKLRVPEYFWYDPFNPEDFAEFVLVDGLYEPRQPNEKGWLISGRLGLALVRWQGEYRGVTTVWIRWATLDGILLPTERESAEEAQQKAEEAQQKAEEAQQKAEEAQQKAEEAQQKAEEAEEKAERLAAKLRELGINPESL
ncbi:MAG: Uma2 family endonuclease [Microcystis aeruginosa Ma_QC_Ch_20071001_S25]|uniref:Uma2 family endonuclease n=1 Tax=Microcystis aeruginosa Ma_QC_Ch_20071001_S25D TaxID=2486250 RepID=A0A552FDR9_MICAE|nr:MAG: Uma2 family endonuclease [Microcystis aeruginosa Ma_QC_Ch_20071001_S25D]TRU47547.1 MAG: Uma2 family endonuclease [Microcystis aeruginosa Ma_QC_Ch_20071001_S25]TRU56051.1 MAG: Uma2 family endonuclease [Microcystis aeruginosa Ma_QC_Ch_20071001_M135]